MERRRRFKVQDLGVEQLVNELLARGETYESISRRLNEQGKCVSVPSIHRYNQDLQRKLEKVRATSEAANALCAVIKEKTGSEPDSQMSDALVAILQHSIMEKLGDDEIKTKDLVGLSIAGSSLVKSKAALERMKETERTRARKAWQEAIAEVKSLLEKSDLWPQVEQILTGGMKEAIES